MSNSFKQSVKLSLESFEERANPSSSLQPDGTLLIVGRDVADTVKVEYVSGGWQGYYYMAPRLNVIENGVNTGSYMASSVSKIEFHGYGGNDFFDNWAYSWNVEAYGGEGNDTLYGWGGNDTLVGGIGDDVLKGYGGNDFLYGNEGKDALWGHQGNDTLDGGNDTIADYMSGGSGYDVFQRDMHFVWSPYGYYYHNFDAAQDFNYSEDVYNGDY